MIVQWMEYPNVEVTVVATKMSEADLVKIVDGLREAGTVEWALLGGAALIDPNAGVPPDATTRAAIVSAFEGWLDGSHPEASRAVVEDADSIWDALVAAHASNANAQDYRGQVKKVALLDDNTAAVTYSIVQGIHIVFDERNGLAVKQAGVWKVSRETVCGLIALAGGHAVCPPRP
jgi:hypothetical protein